MKDTKFSIARVTLLMKLDLVVNYRIIVIFAASIASLLFLSCLISPIRVEAVNFHPILYALLLFIGGFWITSQTFKELHDKERNYIFLTLPSSNFEKFLNKLLLTSIGYVIATLVGYFLLSVIVSGLSVLFFKYPQPLFNPFRYDILFYIRDYLIIQAVFLLGAVYFKKYVLSKIILSLSCLAIALLIFTFMVSVLFGLPRFFNYDFWSNLLPHTLKMLFWLFLAPCCWVITYLRLKEAEL